MKERNQKKKRDKSRRKYGLWGASAEGLTDTATGCRVLLLLWEDHVVVLYVHHT